MKKYMYVTNETLAKIMSCFANREELNEFAMSLSITVDEITYAASQAIREEPGTERFHSLIAKQYFHMALFCRKNIDVIHELIKAVDYSEITEEEKTRLENESIESEDA